MKTSNLPISISSADISTCRVSGQWKAWLKDHPYIQAYGFTDYEAIGNLIYELARMNYEKHEGSKE